jgi:hypothetical protein
MRFQKYLVEKVILKQNKPASNDYILFDVYNDKTKVGYIEGYFTHEIELVSVEIKSKYRSKGYGSSALRLIKEKYKGRHLNADCISQESFFTLIKAFGKPISFGSIYKEFDNYDQVQEYLPKTKELEGAGASDGVSVKFKL